MTTEHKPRGQLPETTPDVEWLVRNIKAFGLPAPVGTIEGLANHLVQNWLTMEQLRNQERDAVLTELGLALEAVIAYDAAVEGEAMRRIRGEVKQGLDAMYQECFRKVRAAGVRYEGLGLSPAKER